MDVVDTLYSNCVELDKFLLEKGEISLKVFTDANLRKNLLLASASYFEKEISNLIVEFTRQISGDDERLISFVENKAISRQYHNFFTWKENNCNSFLGLFGESFKKQFNQRIAEDTELGDAVKAFLEIGLERNRMVHQDFGQYSLEKTPYEILLLHKKAIPFVKALADQFFKPILVTSD